MPTRSTTNNKSSRLNPKLKKLIIFVIGGAVGLAIIIVVLVTVFTSGATDVSNKFLDLVQANQPQEAYALMSSQGMQATSASEFAEVVNRAGPILNTDEKITNKEISAESGRPTISVITYEVTGTDNRKYELKVTLIKEANTWKVLGFDSNQQ